MAIAPQALSAGAVEGMSESTSAGLEAPNYEHQLVRINTGINFIRLSRDVLESMPISEDSEWVDKVVANMDTQMVQETLSLNDVKNDAYFSTAIITNVILRRPVLHMSPAIIRLYYVASVIYKNEANGNPDFHIPDMNEFPDYSSIKSFTHFKENEKVAYIDVEAKNGNLYKNLDEAILSMLPEDLQESANDAYAEYIVERNIFKDKAGDVNAVKAWIDDEKNSGNPDMANRKKGLEVLEQELEEQEKVFNSKKNVYLAILDKGADAIEANFDPSKVKLAKKVDKLLEFVDDGAINAISLFVSASIGIYKGYGEVDKELKALAWAQGLSTLVGNQKVFIIERAKRMVTGTLLAIPNITVGTYIITAGRGKISTYKDVVEAVLDGAKAMDESTEAQLQEQKMQEIDNVQEQTNAKMQDEDTKDDLEILKQKNQRLKRQKQNNENNFKKYISSI